MPCTILTPPCPECSHAKSKVLSGRPSICGKIYRQRLCQHCGWIFETIQQPETILTDYVKIKNNSRRGHPRTVTLQPLGKIP